MTYMYIDILIIIITFPYSTCISSFFGSSIPTSLFIFKMFFSFFNIITTSLLLYHILILLLSPIIQLVLQLIVIIFYVQIVYYACT